MRIESGQIPQVRIKSTNFYIWKSYFFFSIFLLVKNKKWQRPAVRFRTEILSERECASFGGFFSILLLKRSWFVWKIFTSNFQCNHWGCCFLNIIKIFGNFKHDLKNNFMIICQRIQPKNNAGNHKKKFQVNATSLQRWKRKCICNFKNLTEFYRC